MDSSHKLNIVIAHTLTVERVAIPSAPRSMSDAQVGSFIGLHAKSSWPWLSDTPLPIHVAVCSVTSVRPIPPLMITIRLRQLERNQPVLCVCIQRLAMGSDLLLLGWIVVSVAPAGNDDLSSDSRDELQASLVNRGGKYEMTYHTTLLSAAWKSAVTVLHVGLPGQSVEAICSNSTSPNKRIKTTTPLSNASDAGFDLSSLDKIVSQLHALLRAVKAEMGSLVDLDMLPFDNLLRSLHGALHSPSERSSSALQTFLVLLYPLHGWSQLDVYALCDAMMPHPLENLLAALQNSGSHSAPPVSWAPTWRSIVVASLAQWLIRSHIDTSLRGVATFLDSLSSVHHDPVAARARARRILAWRDLVRVAADWYLEPYKHKLRESTQMRSEHRVAVLKDAWDDLRPGEVILRCDLRPYFPTLIKSLTCAKEQLASSLGGGESGEDGVTHGKPTTRLLDEAAPACIRGCIADLRQNKHLPNLDAVMLSMAIFRISYDETRSVVRARQTVLDWYQEHEIDLNDPVMKQEHRSFGTNTIARLDGLARTPAASEPTIYEFGCRRRIQATLNDDNSVGRTCPWVNPVIDAMPHVTDIEDLHEQVRSCCSQEYGGGTTLHSLPSRRWKAANDALRAGHAASETAKVTRSD